MRWTGLILLFCLITQTVAFGDGEHPNQHRRAKEDRPSAARIVVDVVPMRLVGAVATVLGSALFVVTFPFTAFSGPEDALYTLVVDPFRYTFVRPLGKFDNWEDDELQMFDPVLPAPIEEEASVDTPTEEAPDF